MTPSNERYREEGIAESFRGIRSQVQARNVVEEQYPEFLENYPENSSSAQAKDYLRDRINELEADQLEYIDSDLPSGIPSSITSLLPEPKRDHDNRCGHVHAI